EASDPRRRAAPGDRGPGRGGIRPAQLLRALDLRDRQFAAREGRRHGRRAGAEDGRCPLSDGGRDGSARFAPGDRVVVRGAEPPGHLRTPYYIRGRAGVVERICGAFPNPEELAYGRDGTPARPLYRVRFRQADVWPDYAGPGEDAVEVEIY